MTGEGLGDTSRTTGEGLGEGLGHKMNLRKSLILKGKMRNSLFHGYAEVRV